MKFTLSALSRFASSARSHRPFSPDDMEAAGAFTYPAYDPIEKDGPILSRAQADQILSSDKELYRSFYALAVVGVHLLEQSLSALGTYKLLEASKKAVDGANPMNEFFTFLLTTFVASPVVQALGQVLQLGWQNHDRKKFDNAFIAHDYARPALWAMNKGSSDAADPINSANQQAIRLDTFANQLRGGVKEEIISFCELSNLGVATFVNMALFATTMGFNSTAALGVSSLGAMAFSRHALAQTTAYAHQSENTQKNLRQRHKGFWDNVVIGNLINYDRWISSFNKLETLDRSAKMSVAINNATRQIQLQAITAMPVSVVLAAHARTLTQRGDTTGLIRDLVLQLPRLVSTVGQLATFSDQLFSQFFARRVDLNRALTTARATPALDLAAHAKPELILVRHGANLHPWPEMRLTILAKIHAGKSGLYTVYGPNGAGKSLEMLQLHADLGPDLSMYVPTNLKDMTWPDEQNGSTGQKNLMAYIQALKNGPQVIIFDEPHANLDEINRRLFDELAKASADAEKRTIIVISHQPPQYPLV